MISPPDNGNPHPDADEGLFPGGQTNCPRPGNEETGVAGAGAGGESELSPLRLRGPALGEPLPRRPSRGRQGRAPVCSKYRMAWVMVFFDLPVGTPEERKAAANFRKDLVRDGYIMVQYSVYARPCGSADRVETHVRRLKANIPSKGEVRGLLISDAQWGRMIVVRSEREVESEQMPRQMLFF